MQEENHCCHRTGRCKPRNDGGKRLGLVAAQGTTAKPNLNPLLNVQPSSVDGAMGGGIQPKISKMMLRNKVLEVNIVENGFSHDLLYYKGQINNRMIHILIDGGSMGDFVSTRVVQQLNLKTMAIANQLLAFANRNKANCNQEAQNLDLSIGVTYIQGRTITKPRYHPQ